MIRRYFPHLGIRTAAKAVLACSVLILLAVPLWWSRDPSGAVDDGAIPYDAATLTTQTGAAGTTTTPDLDGPGEVTIETARLAARARAGAAGAALDEPQTPVPPTPRPTGLFVEDLDVRAEILPVGIEEDGELQIPERVDDVGWFAAGAAPGGHGSAVLVGHVDATGQGPGAFFGLRRIDLASRILVTDEHGGEQWYEVQARREYDKETLPIDSLFRRGGQSVLTLITCGGDFDAATRSYESNVVVYAIPVGERVSGADG